MPMPIEMRKKIGLAGGVFMTTAAIYAIPFNTAATTEGKRPPNGKTMDTSASAPLHADPKRPPNG